MSKKGGDLDDFLTGFGSCLGTLTLFAIIGFFIAVAASR